MTHSSRAWTSRCVLTMIAVLATTSAHAQSTSRASASVTVQGEVQRRDTSGYPARRAMIAQLTQMEQRALTMKPGRDRDALVAQSTMLRDRLTNGDFRVGDQIDLRVQGVAALTDTFTVREGRMLELPDIPPIPLAGVLRSELPSYLTTRIAKYVVNPVIEAHPFVRVGVLGAVAKPGYYAVRPDQIMSDALMAAGGPTAEADIRKTVIRRGGRDTDWKGKRMEQALASGQTLDAMDVRSGDELVIDQRVRRDWGQLTQTGVYVAAGLASLYVALHRK